ncbi:hypothetical protein, partial [Roseibacillus persicicus]|uniref:hypothetical protein n=1 Tax=Roseibacillus persicicus TaxID=454148 RepID=UPI00280F64B9
IMIQRDGSVGRVGALAVQRWGPFGVRAACCRFEVDGFVLSPPREEQSLLARPRTTAIHRVMIAK